MRHILSGLVILVVVIVGAIWYFSDPDISRATLAAKYGTPPSQFITIDYPPTGTGASGGKAGSYVTRVHLRDAGPRNAPVLVLVHGSNASFLTWEPWVKRLSDTYRVVTIDMPGHGLTGAVPSEDYSQAGMVAFTLAVTEKLGLKSFALGGNSMGGGVAARFAEEHPDRLTALILVDAAGMPGRAGDRIPLAFRLARIPVINRVLLYVTPRMLAEQGLNKAIVRKKIITDAMIDSYWEFARMEGTRQATIERFGLPMDSFVKDHIAQIKAPTLILWGDQDGLIPVASAHAFAKAIPGSKLIIYTNVGHIPMEEVADQSAADVRAFLAERATSKPD